MDDVLRLTIVRGLPGSGKSKFANSLKGVVTVDDDSFFETDDGYKFKEEYYKDSFKYIQAMAMYHLFRGKSVVVTSPFIKVKDITPFKGIAKRYNAIFEIVEVKGNYGSTHGVPVAVMQDMRDNWEVYPPKKKVRKK